MSFLKRIFSPKSVKSIIEPEKKKKHLMRHENDIIGTNTISVIDGDGTVWVHLVKEHPFVFQCTNNIASKQADGTIMFFFHKSVGLDYPGIKTYIFTRT